MGVLESPKEKGEAAEKVHVETESGQEGRSKIMTDLPIFCGVCDLS